MLIHFGILFAILVAQAACLLSKIEGLNLFHHQKTDALANTPPSQDLFYEVPCNISDYDRGAILRWRPVPNAAKVWGPDSGNVYQLLFRTNSVHMTPDASVTTVIAPKYPAKGPPKIVGVAAPEDSPAVDCALSWSLVPNTNSDEAWGGISGNTITAQAALHLGYYVTIPDDEGSKAGWLAYSEGQILLDSIIALANFKEMIPDSTGYKAAMTGYSGGGHGSAWAAQLASTYADDIPIVAVATGGIPVDPKASLEYLDGGIAAAMCFAGVAGLGNVYPKFNNFLNSIMTPTGVEQFAKLRDGSICLQKSLLHFLYHKMKYAFKTTDYLTNPIALEVIDENYLGKHQAPILKFPFYQVHTQVDDVVPYGPAIAWWQQQCDKGGKFILTNPSSGKHVKTGQLAISSFFYFIKGAFEGTLHVPACNRTTDFLIDPTGPEAVATVGQTIVDWIHSQTKPFLSL